MMIQYSAQTNSAKNCTTCEKHKNGVKEKMVTKANTTKTNATAITNKTSK